MNHTGKVSSTTPPTMILLTENDHVKYHVKYLELSYAKPYTHVNNSIESSCMTTCNVWTVLNRGVATFLRALIGRCKIHPSQLTLKNVVNIASMTYTNMATHTIYQADPTAQDFK